MRYIHMYIQYIREKEKKKKKKKRGGSAPVQLKHELTFLNV